MKEILPNLLVWKRHYSLVHILHLSVLSIGIIGITLILGIQTLFSSSAFAEPYENENFSLSESGGLFQNPISLILSPKNGRTVQWSFFSQNPSNTHSTSEATRILIPRKRDMYVFTEKTIPKKFSFEINRSRENIYFRIEKIDITPQEGFVPTITLKNNSSFAFSMQGWTISGTDFDIDLPTEELEAEEERVFILPFVELKKGEEILLTSPSQRVRDRVALLHTNTRTLMVRKKTKYPNRETRPPFIIQRKKDISQ